MQTLVDTYNKIELSKLVDKLQKEFSPFRISCVIGQWQHEVGFTRWSVHPDCLAPLTLDTGAQYQLVAVFRVTKKPGATNMRTLKQDWLKMFSVAPFPDPDSYPDYRGQIGYDGLWLSNAEGTWVGVQQRPRTDPYRMRWSNFRQRWTTAEMYELDQLAIRDPEPIEDTQKILREARIAKEDLDDFSLVQFIRTLWNAFWWIVAAAGAVILLGFLSHFIWNK